MSEEPKTSNIPPEILALMPVGKDARPSHESVDDGSYHGTDPTTVKFRDPKNARRVGPRRTQAALDPDAPWGCG